LRFNANDEKKEKIKKGKWKFERHNHNCHSVIG
jgi:hypothetical protein